ncbi:MAG: nickel pincer cofactor biosynthesis protein LarC [Candidatus Hodarchaeota archaeon]
MTQLDILVIDPSVSGASGDLLISSILDLQEESFRKEFCQLFQKILSEHDPDFKVKCHSVKKQGFSGCQVHTTAIKEFLPNEMLELIEKTSEILRLSPKSREMAVSSLNFLIEAEKKVHNQNSLSSDLHFHELATIDTIFDVVGLAFLWDQLNFHNKKIYVLPIAVGGGHIKIAHGNVSVPAPATSEIILRGKLLIKGGPIERELLTPTGAALLASLGAISLKFLPCMHIEKIGRGYGTRECGKEVGCFLRIIQGYQSTLTEEEITILETNIDDVDGETLGYLFDVLFADNLVLDLSILNTLSKKNRPGFLIRGVVEPSKVPQVINILTRELGTLGVRVLGGYRHVLPRKQNTYQVKVLNGTETIRLKRGFLESEIISEKVEYEDLRRIAKEKGVSLQKIRKIILDEIKKQEVKQDENNA